MEEDKGNPFKLEKQSSRTRDKDTAITHFTNEVNIASIEFKNSNVKQTQDPTKPKISLSPTVY